MDVNTDLPTLFVFAHHPLFVVLDNTVCVAAGLDHGVHSTKALQVLLASGPSESSADEGGMVQGIDSLLSLYTKMYAGVGWEQPHPFKKDLLSERLSDPISLTRVAMERIMDRPRRFVDLPPGVGAHTNSHEHVSKRSKYKCSLNGVMLDQSSISVTLLQRSRASSPNLSGHG